MPHAPTTTPDLDELDRWILNEIQFDFPLAENPWSAIAARRGVTGDEVLQRVNALKSKRVIRQISPIFDTKALGYRSMLVAAKVPAEPPERIDAAAEVVNQHPGVSHNYQRDAAYNLWFTLAVPPGEDFDAHLERLRIDAKLDSVLALPAIVTFHIGVKLDLKNTQGAGSAPRDADDDGDRSTHVMARNAVPLSERDKLIIRHSQDDLAMVERPFDSLCATLGMSFDQLRGWFDEMKAKGVLRRFAAILRHRQVGFSANAMVCWNIPQSPPERIADAGAIAARVAEVSHCYQRPSYPDWPYSLYTMIHAQSQAQSEQVIARLAQSLQPLGLGEYRALYSSREFKKVRLRYFV